MALSENNYISFLLRCKSIGVINLCIYRLKIITSKARFVEMMFTYVFIDSALLDIPSSYTSFILLTSSRETWEEVIWKVPSLFWRGYRFWWCSWCTSCPLKQLCPAIPFVQHPLSPQAALSKLKRGFWYLFRKRKENRASIVKFYAV